MRPIPLTPPLLTQYDFIFGFSPGHSGTTLLTSKVLYNKDLNVKYFFEFKGSKLKYQYRELKTAPMTTWEYQRNTDKDDTKYVKRLIDFFNACRENNTVLDLGHENLYFVRPLIRYLREHTRYSFCFVRLIRDRYELAESLKYTLPGHRVYDLCTERWVQLCPWDRPRDVLVPIPGRFIWRQFTTLQQAFWIIDEVEQRWQQLLREFPDIHFLEIHWDKMSTVLDLQRHIESDHYDVNSLQPSFARGNTSGDDERTIRLDTSSRSLYSAAELVAELLCIRANYDKPGQYHSAMTFDEFVRVSDKSFARGNITRFISRHDYKRCGKLAINRVEFSHLSSDLLKIHAGNVTNVNFMRDPMIVQRYSKEYEEYRDLRHLLVSTTHPLARDIIGLNVGYLTLFLLLNMVFGNWLSAWLWKCCIGKDYHGKKR